MSHDEIAFLTVLAEREIAYIKTLPQPVVRVCGPLTCDGPEGYARNAERLATAEKILKKQGSTVWSFVQSEKEIVGKGFDHHNIVTYFHAPVLRSGLIAATYFLPGSERSSGARRERALALENNITIKEFPEAWFTERENKLKPTGI